MLCYLFFCDNRRQGLMCFFFHANCQRAYKSRGRRRRRRVGLRKVVIVQRYRSRQNFVVAVVCGSRSVCSALVYFGGPQMLACLRFTFCFLVCLLSVVCSDLLFCLDGAAAREKLRAFKNLKRPSMRPSPWFLFSGAGQSTVLHLVKR